MNEMNEMNKMNQNEPKWTKMIQNELKSEGKYSEKIVRDSER